MSNLIANNDRDMLLYLMQAFDGECWNCPACGHGEETKTMDSATFLREYLEAKPMNNTPQETITQEVIDDALKAGILLDGVGGKALLNDLIKFAQLTRERQRSSSEVVATVYYNEKYGIKILPTTKAMQQLKPNDKLYLAAPQQAIAAGWKLVPIEPTKEMLIASTNSKSPWNIIDAYKAMLSAVEYK